MSKGGKPKVESTVCRGKEGLLLLDLDTEDSVRTFVTLLPIVQKLYGLADVKIWPSASKGVHASVQLIYPAQNVVAIQAFLGSDPVRAELTFEEWRSGDALHECNILYKPKKCACGEAYLSVREPVWCGACERFAKMTTGPR